MTRRQLTALVTAWHRDNPTLNGKARQRRQRELWDALAATGGEHDTGELLALCDDVEPFVVVFDRTVPSGVRGCLHPDDNRSRIAYLRALNARRFGTRARKAVGA